MLKFFLNCCKQNICENLLSTIHPLLNLTSPYFNIFLSFSIFYPLDILLVLFISSFQFEFRIHLTPFLEPTLPSHNTYRIFLIIIWIVKDLQIYDHSQEVHTEFFILTYTLIFPKTLIDLSVREFFVGGLPHLSCL